MWKDQGRIFIETILNWLSLCGNNNNFYNKFIGSDFEGLFKIVNNNDKWVVFLILKSNYFGICILLRPFVIILKMQWFRRLDL